ncbi:MAG: rRNA pseudouridine synthase [Ruminococcaceae bacterium]|nr:rRNA pseudouridine synthase [Oscillospiraceae bacterium]
MELVRVSKYFTDCGIMSRRAADAAVADGLVTVNGNVAELGQKIDPTRDIVKYKGKVVKPSTDRGEKICIMLNKPRGYVTTMSDEKGRRTVAELCADAGVRLYPIGRLDMDSDGLLLLTNDGELANYLSHPSHRVDKVYVAVVAGNVTTAQLEGMTRPIEIDGKTTSPARIKKIGSDGQLTAIEVTIHDGRRHQVRKLCAREGLKVKSLTRTAEGSLTLGNLPLGKWRKLTAAEIKKLKG